MTNATDLSDALRSAVYAAILEQSGVDRTTHQSIVLDIDAICTGLIDIMAQLVASDPDLQPDDIDERSEAVAAKFQMALEAYAADAERPLRGIETVGSLN